MDAVNNGMASEIQTATFSVKIIGDSSLIVNKWDSRERNVLGRIKSPWIDYCDSLYWISEKPEYPVDEDIKMAKFGFPTTGIKNSIIDAAFQRKIISKKARTRSFFNICGELVEIEGRPQIREDVVFLSGSVSECFRKYRAEFTEWAMKLDIRYRVDAITTEEIIDMLNLGGKDNGIGEWRPSKNGDHGTFHVAVSGE